MKSKKGLIGLAFSLILLTSCSFNIKVPDINKSETPTVEVNTPEKTEATEQTPTPEVVKPTPTPTPEVVVTPTPEVTPTQTPVVVEYTVKFKNETESTDVKVKENEKVSKPTDPTREGYKFLGWYLNNTKYDFNTLVKSNIELIAKWELNEYIITFNTNGGSSVTSQTIKYNQKLSSVSTTKEHYEFIGWFTDSNLTKEFSFDTPITSTLTLYAKWKENTKYTVTFMNDTLTFTTLSVYENETVTLPTDSPTKDGYRFIGWYTDSNLTLEFNTQTKITSNTTLYALFEEIDGIQIKANGGYDEGMYVEFQLYANTKLSDYKVSYKKSNDTSYTLIDSNLIREINSSTLRADILGLAKGKYSIKVHAKNSTIEVESIISDVEVSAIDRSGYAHYNNANAVGGYNNDGTVKTNAIIIYVTEANKNTVTAQINGKTYTGLASILQNQSKSSQPLIVRIIGTIGAATWNSLTVSAYSEATTSTVKGANNQYLALQNYTEEQIISAGFNTLNETQYKKLNGLTNRIKYDSSKKEFDSYYNMLDISNATNVTVEGIGTDATLFQWGFTWKGCQSIEVRNLTFNDYTEDACSFEGGSSENTESLSGFSSKYYWLHNNTFNRGVNYWDVCSEQDKHDGDGCTDFKYCSNVTVSYNHYYKTHKTGLVGGSDTQHSANITFHHNYYDECQSRLPFARQANMHMYNNYYYGSTGTNMQIYAGAYAFIEACYFENAKNPMVLREGGAGSGFVSRKAGAKLYNNEFVNCSGTNGGTVVTSRTATVENDNCYSPTFDTDSTLFYYDSTTNTTKVSYLTTASIAKTDCVKYAGVLTNKKCVSSNNINGGTTETETYTITYVTNMDGLTKESDNVASGEAITLENLKKDGYTFDGWYLESSFTNKVSSSYTPESSVTLYAKWNSASSASGMIADNQALNTSYKSGSTIYTSDKFDVVATGINPKITQGISKAVANDNSGREFSYAYLPGGSTNSGSVGYTITAKQTTTITIYFITTDSKFSTQDQSKGGDLRVNGAVVTTVSGNKSNKIAYAYTLSITQGESYFIDSSANRLAIFAII